MIRLERPGRHLRAAAVQVGNAVEAIVQHARQKGRPAHTTGRRNPRPKLVDHEQPDIRRLSQ